MKNILFTFLALLASIPAHAAIINVSTTTDELEADYAADCSGGTGCSLREALELANVTAGQDSVKIPAGTFNLTLGQISILDDTSIQGVSQTQTIINGTSNNGRFLNLTGLNYSTVILKKMKVQNFTDTSGACLLSQVNTPSLNLQLENLQFENNSATEYGGCIATFGLSISENVTIGMLENNFINNTGRTRGGALYGKFTGIYALISTFRANSVTSLTGFGGAMYLEDGGLLGAELLFEDNRTVGSGSSGGAVMLWQSNFLITSSLFLNNATMTTGGAIRLFSRNTTQPNIVSIKNSSLIGNSARLGGAIFSDSTNNIINRLEISGSTLAGNITTIAGAADPGWNGKGSALYLSNTDTNISYSTIAKNIANVQTLEASAAIFETYSTPSVPITKIKSSIISENLAQLLNDPSQIRDSNCAISSEFIGLNLSHIESHGFNLIKTDCANRATLSTANPDYVGIDPQFTGVYLQKGTRDFTLQLALTSPALDKAENGTCKSLPDFLSGTENILTTDAMGNVRAFGTFCDIGALEPNNCPLINFYSDADGDGFGIDGAFTLCGTAVSGFANNNDDCDDTNPSKLTTTSDETCDAVDNNCNGTIDEGFPDTDGNGVADCVPVIPETCDGIDNNGNGQVDEGFPDTDGDTVKDCVDECDSDSTKTTAGVCGCNNPDTDADTDGVPQCLDLCEDDASKTSPGQCGCGIADLDSDGDGIATCVDLCDGDPAKSDPGVCGCGQTDTDTDGDGAADCVDECDNDGSKKESGICGCGLSDDDTDGDGDGVLDCQETCDFDASKTDEGLCGCGAADTDTDGDTTANCSDACVDDASKTSPGICGCGTADTDTDSDGIADCIDSEECDDLDNNGDGNINEGLDCSITTPEEPTPSDPTPTSGNKSSGGGCSLSVENSSPSNGFIVSLLMAASLLLTRKKILS